jgi:hypothetical protein
LRKKLFAILGLVVLVVLLAVFVPSCTPAEEKGTIQVKATLCGDPWPTQGTGLVNYTLTPASGSPINGNNVTASFSVATGNWTCAYANDGSGPAGAYLVDITPLATQEVSSGGTKTFTLNFELNQDAAIEWLTWTVNGELWQTPTLEVVPCNVIDVHFKQWVDGCEGYEVAINETSWLSIMQVAGPGGVQIYVVDDLCAVVKEPEPIDKVSQVPSFNEETAKSGKFYPLPPPEMQMPALLDVETAWLLEKEIDYTKSINWLGISIFAEPVEPHPCVLFELVLPVQGPQYVFILQSSAEVALVDDEDVNPGNDHTMSPQPLTLIVNTA